MSDIFDALKNARELMRRMEPFPKAIWIVDRPDLLHRIRELFSTYAPLANPHRLFFTGIPIYEWRNYGAVEEDYHRAPWFVRLPGVWIEMSDHQHKRLAL